MFDPTAFDNMKVVIEGALYDLDILGEIVIADRNDIVNMAKMSRNFDVTFHLSEGMGETVSAKISIEATLLNLAAELLPQQWSKSQNQSGSKVKLEFFYKGVTEKEHIDYIQGIFTELWGETRLIRQTVIIQPSHSHSLINNVVTVEFDRLIGEDQMEDFVEMINVMTTAIQQLQFYLNGIEKV
jgi:hypothetical protein